MKKKNITETTVKTKTYTSYINIKQLEPTSNSSDFSDDSPLISSSPMTFKTPPNRRKSLDTDESDAPLANDGSVSVLSSPREEVYDFVKDETLEKYIYRQISEASYVEKQSELNIGNETNSNLNIGKRVVGSSFIAFGTGLAMMPIFNHLVKNSEMFGVDIHNNKVAFDLSTSNTFVIAFFSSYASSMKFIESCQTGNYNYGYIFSKLTASASIVLPIGLLWVTELNNQKVAESEGFDKYIAWATFTTLPLVIDRVIESVTNVDSIVNTNEDIIPMSTGAKLVTYGLTSLSLAGRTIVFTEVAKGLALASGFDANISLAIGIATGGIVGSAGVSVFEYKAIKSLFESEAESMTIRKAICGSIAILEGSWFTLPLIGAGLEATNDWNPLLKGVLFVPLLVSHTVLESAKIYDNASWFCESLSDFGSYCWDQYAILTSDSFSDQQDSVSIVGDTI